MSLQLDPKYVTTGVWIDQAKGNILGSTLTTDRKTGNLLVALLAVVSTLGTAHLWHLIAFAVHQARANGRPKDALFRQQQALLRTLPTPSAIMADSIKLWWAWRKKTDRPLLRSLFLILLALVFTTATVAASIFSSLVVDTGSIVVLVDSPLCGDVHVITDESNWLKLFIDDEAPNYAHYCYRNTSLAATNCNVFMNPNVTFHVEDAPCPFNATMCVPKTAVAFESGLVDIPRAFGLNLEAKDRVSYRRRTTCTVLPLENHTEIHEASDVPPSVFSQRDPEPGEQLVSVFYGLPLPPDLENFAGTTLASLRSTNRTVGPSFQHGSVYYTNPRGVNTLGRSQLLPIKELRTTKGDTMFKTFMNKNTAYRRPVDDPLFSAHKMRIRYADEMLKNQTQYIADWPMVGLACLGQHQYCHARNGKEDYCTPLEGKIDHDFNQTWFPEANEMQTQLIRNLDFATRLHDIQTVETSQTYGMVDNVDKMINSLPDDWWKTELQYHEAEVWASLQIAFSRFAVGHEALDPSESKDQTGPTTPAQEALCKAQKMRLLDDFVNVNVFGLSFVIGFSVLVAIIDITLLKFLVFLTRFRRSIAPRVERWIQDGVWQLQRRAYEGEGHRNWTNLEDDIPLMQKGHKLKDLPILWLPGKSPAIMQSETFGSTSTLSDYQNVVENNVTATPAEIAEEPIQNQKPKWYTRLWRHEQGPRVGYI